MDTARQVMSSETQLSKSVAIDWWGSKRCQYNKGLIIAGFIAFLLYCILGETIIAKHEEFEETIFEMALQGGIYLMTMMIAIFFIHWMVDGYTF